MLCSENPSGSKGCCHRMCCCWETKGLFLPLFAWLCLSRNGIEVAESNHPRAGVKMSQPGVWLHHANFPACFPDFAATLIIKEVKENPLKTENTFGFLFKQTIVTPFLSYWITIQDTFRYFCALYNKIDSIGVESKIMLFKGNAKKKEIKYSSPA